MTALGGVYPKIGSSSSHNLFPTKIQEFVELYPLDVNTKIIGASGDPTPFLGFQGEMVQAHDELRQRAQNFAELSEQSGIDVPLYIRKEQGYESLCMRSIEGTNLDRIIERGLGHHIADQIDTLWAGLVNYLVYCKQNARPCALGIYTTECYTFGKENGAGKRRLWLDDPEILNTEFSENTSPDLYAADIEGLLEIILDLEASIGQQLPLSRESLFQAIDILSSPQTMSSALDTLGSAS